ncbi:GPI transamidase component PIG-T [Anthonomus grandis grandis]|uniref:GPI transamidase component PIG-T n=1 Tax=Anthonomus grandis grandis TaxID=2921223 RepID=UPI0021650AED|nr:GPI transamidase component PIG-T [Anthonomus grandis grandis]
MLILILAFHILLHLKPTLCKDDYKESLVILPLSGEDIYTRFSFNFTWDGDPATKQYHHTHLFPRAVAEIIGNFNVEELHLSLTQGLWRYETWGYPFRDAAPGAELWAWFKPDTTDVDKNWKLLANALSGLLCASFNFVDGLNTVSPEYSFRPQGVIDWPKVNNSFLRYSSLPREIVCTENLTPFTKLLPCGSKAGLSSLLNSGYIHNTKFHSLDLSLRRVCSTQECTAANLELSLGVSLVYNYAILGTKNWSFKKLFGQGLNSRCHVASSDKIYVDLAPKESSKQGFELEVEPETYLGKDNEVAVYELRDRRFLNVGVRYNDSVGLTLTTPVKLYAHQYLTGYGQERGGIVTEIYNNHWSSLDIVLLQNIPWYVPIYLHTLKAVSNGRTIEPTVLKYRPGKQRQKAYYLEVVYKLPPHSVTTVSIDFDYVFLKWQEYPPDANHGFYIGSAVISCVLPKVRDDSLLWSQGLVQIRTENLVITLPTPDFSMPYNVICLACTVVALAFGPLHNTTTKRLILMKKTRDGLLLKLKRRFLQKMAANSEKKEE